MYKEHFLTCVWWRTGNANTDNAKLYTTQTGFLVPRTSFAAYSVSPDGMKSFCSDPVQLTGLSDPSGPFSVVFTALLSLMHTFSADEVRRFIHSFVLSMCCVSAWCCHVGPWLIELSGGVLSGFMHSHLPVAILMEVSPEIMEDLPIPLFNFKAVYRAASCILTYQ